MNVSHIAVIVKKYSKDYVKGGNLSNKTVFNRLLSICLPVLSLSTMNLIPTLKHFSAQRVEKAFIPFQKWDFM